MVRLAYERLPHYPFSLDGLKEALLVIEAQFASCISTSETPPLTFQFSESILDSNFRNTNSHVVSVFKDNLAQNFRGHYTALLNNDPPSATERKEERSGCSLLSVFLEQTLAEYQPLIRSSADDTFLRGLEENIHRLAGDFFWAVFIPKYLTVDGNLLAAKKIELEQKVRAMLLNGGIVKIPEEIVPHIFMLMTYILKGTFLLNNLACPESHNVVDNTTCRKRHAIVLRLSEGQGPNKRRRFYISRLGRGLRNITSEALQQQLRILKAHAVITTPTHRSVALERNLNEEAIHYLIQQCEYSNEEIGVLHAANSALTN